MHKYRYIYTCIYEHKQYRITFMGTHVYPLELSIIAISDILFNICWSGIHTVFLHFRQ